MMRTNKSASQVNGLLRRIGWLQKRAAGGARQRAEVASECLGQLRRAVEEIQVAEGQLWQQNEHLLAARQAVEDERGRYQKLFDFAPDGYLVTDSRGVIREANRASGRLLNVSPSCLAGRPLAVFVAKEERPVLRHELSSSAPEGESRTMELRLNPRRAAPFVALVTMAGEADRAGKVIGQRWLFRDITDLKRAEQARCDLEARVRQVLRLESLSTMAGGIAHDFNNLLTIILGNAELAARRLQPGAPVAIHIERIRKAGQRAAELVAEMLAFAGQSKAAVQLQDLRHVVREMTGLLKASVPKKAVLKVDCPSRVPPVLADPIQVRQVLLHLVANASEAIGDRRGSINVAVSSQRADGDRLAGIVLGEKTSDRRYVCLRVRDSGCGMDQETQARMFDPFFSTKLPGRGLGLAAVLGIVKRHNGALKVTSAAGKGTTVDVLLPAAGARP